MMADTEIPQGCLVCSHCKGQGYTGNAYWDEELEWYIYAQDGVSCAACQGEGVQVSTVTTECELESNLQVLAC